MSDLGTIFHVKKNGIQYDAHAYTTLGECPVPNIKLMFKGQQAYVKLAAKGSGDVPCYVRTKAVGLYQVKKEAVRNNQMVVGQFVKTFDADYEYRGYGFSRSDSWLREEFGSLTPNPINGVTIYTIYRAKVIVQGENTGVEFAIDTDKPCKVTIGNDTYTVYKKSGSVYEYKTTGRSNLNWVDGQQFAIKVDLL